MQEDSALQMATMSLSGQKRKSLEGNIEGFSRVKNELSMRNRLFHCSDQLVLP